MQGVWLDFVLFVVEDLVEWILELVVWWKKVVRRNEVCLFFGGNNVKEWISSDMEAMRMRG